MINITCFIFQATIKDTNRTRTISVESDKKFYNEAYADVLQQCRKQIGDKGFNLEVLKSPYKLSDLTDEPFGCCANWKACDMGSKPCVHEKEDPLYAKLCSCFQRNNIVNEKLFYFDETGQGTLF